jgi:hypothetical protein
MKITFSVENMILAGLRIRVFYYKGILPNFTWRLNIAVNDRKHFFVYERKVIFYYFFYREKIGKTKRNKGLLVYDYLMN